VLTFVSGWCIKGIVKARASLRISQRRFFFSGPYHPEKKCLHIHTTGEGKGVFGRELPDALSPFPEKGETHGERTG